MINKIKKLFSKKKVTVERGYNENKNTLDERKFISKTLEDHSKLTSRDCEKCIYYTSDKLDGHCKNKKAKEFFGYTKEERMGTVFGEQKRSWYCKYLHLLKKFRR